MLKLVFYISGIAFHLTYANCSTGLTATHLNIFTQWANNKGKYKKSALGRPRCRWVDNIKMDLREIGWVGMDWIDLAQGRDQWRALVNTVMNFRVP
jgi:hypothetical protein